MYLFFFFPSTLVLIEAPETIKSLPSAVCYMFIATVSAEMNIHELSEKLSRRVREERKERRKEGRRQEGRQATITQMS